MRVSDTLRVGINQDATVSLEAVMVVENAVRAKVVDI